LVDLVGLLAATSWAVLARGEERDYRLDQLANKYLEVRHCLIYVVNRSEAEGKLEKPIVSSYSIIIYKLLILPVLIAAQAGHSRLESSLVG
jgi:hypothetical protein